MSEHDLSNKKPTRKSRRTPLIAGALAATLAAGAAGAALIPGGGKDPRTKDRVTLATHPYKDPSIMRVVNAGGTDALGPERERVLVTLSLPENPATEKLRKKYASNNDAKSISWLVPYSVQTAAINTNNGKPTATEMGFIPSAEGDSFSGRAPIHEDRGTATVEIDPLKSDKDGTKTALFVEVNDFDIEGGALKNTDGYQYIGTLIRQNGQWGIDTNQAPLDDFSQTTSQK